MLHANVDPATVEVKPKLTLVFGLVVVMVLFGVLVSTVSGATAGGGGGGVRAPDAASAFSSPAPWKLPGTPANGAAVDVMAALIAATLADGNFCRSSAATAAACGAADDVPQKTWLTPLKKVVWLQSVATRSGLASTRGVASGAAGVAPLTGPNRVVTGP